MFVFSFLVWHDASETPLPNSPKNQNTPEACFPDQFPPTVPTPTPAPAPTPSPFLPNIVVVPAPSPGPIQSNVVVVIDPIRRAPTTTPASQTRPGSYVGNDCVANSDCGENEMCFSHYDPVCSGTCICKEGYDQDSRGKCTLKSKLREGDTCSVYTRPDMLSDQKNMICDWDDRVSCDYCPCSSVNQRKAQDRERCNDDCGCDGDMVCNTFQRVCMCSSTLQQYDSNLKMCISRYDRTGQFNGVGCRQMFGCQDEGTSCETNAMNYNECKCSGTGFVYNYTLFACVPKNYGDRCQSDAECRGSGSIELGHGYASYQGARCVVGQCRCNNGYTKVSTAVDVISSLWQRKPHFIDICVPDSVALGSRVPKGGSCNTNAVAIRSQFDRTGGLCEEGLYCVQCPKESTGKCREVRDTVRD